MAQEQEMPDNRSFVPNHLEKKNALDANVD